MAKTSGPSMTSIAYDSIRSDILTGRFAADQKIKISDLVRDLGLSLGSVREALSRLDSEGLVQPRRTRAIAWSRSRPRSWPT